MDQYNNYHNEAEQGMNDKCDKKNAQNKKKGGAQNKKQNGAQNKADRGEMC